MALSPTGILLAAGNGTRLRPLTLACPKALVPLHGIPLLEFSLRSLEDAGCRCIAINGHHLSRQLEEWLKSRQQRHAETELRFFHEETLLGVGGGLKRMSAELPDGPLLVQNADIVHDFPLGKLLLEHHDAKATISLVLAGKPHVVTVAENRITGFLEESHSTHGFTGIHFLSDELRERLAQWDASGIISFYQQLLEGGWGLQALTPPPGSLWVDMGHVAEYLPLHRRLWNHGPYRDLLDTLKLTTRWSSSEEKELMESMRHLGIMEEGQNCS
jgi:mannose-1-phosphate guanylyltransferase